MLPAGNETYRKSFNFFLANGINWSPLVGHASQSLENVELENIGEVYRTVVIRNVLKKSIIFKSVFVIYRRTLKAIIQVESIEM
jgi:hypothetical protein